jgi:hypothetical protein
MDDKVYDAILRIHDKIDGIATDISKFKVSITDNISNLKISIATLPSKAHNVRIRILELIVYGAVSLVLIAFMASLSGKATKTSIAKEIKKPKIITEQVE